MQWAEAYERFTRDPGDAAAWTMLEGSVRAWARPDLWNRGWSVVDEVVAEVCAEVVMGLDKARGASTFAGFARGYYLNVKRRALQLQKSAAASLDGIDPPAPADEPAEDDLALHVLDGCLAELPPREARAIRLRYFERASSDHIASVLEVSSGNARRIVFNALARLRRCVSQRVGQEHHVDA